MAWQQVVVCAGALAYQAAALRAAGREEEHTVMALAAYDDRDVADFPLMFVNSLRGVGFEGNIFLGMWEGTTDNTGYLKQDGVTPKYIRPAECRLRYSKIKEDPNNVIRSTCTEDFPHLKLETSRYLYARRWLQECPSCGGWAMFADFGDVNFQQNPFALLPRASEVPAETVYLTEEMRPRMDAFGRKRGVSTSHWLVSAGVENCYGGPAGLNVSDKPMINVGTTFGTRAGMLRLLGRLEEEFELKSTRKRCDPLRMADQGLLNHLFYNVGAMPYAEPKEYGKWIVNTMGAPCSNELGAQPDASMRDIAIIDSAKLVWNEDGTLPAVLHQGKVCHMNYAGPFLRKLMGHRAPGSYAELLRGRLAGATFPDTSGMATASPPS